MDTIEQWESGKFSFTTEGHGEKKIGTDFTDYTAKFFMKAGHPAFM
jgi:hypothetical protein